MALETSRNKVIQKLAGFSGQQQRALYETIVNASPLVDVAADVTLTQRQHAGKTMVLNVASGATVTLPAATGTGDVYEFIVATSVTSNSYKIQVANSTDVFIGNSISLQDAGDTMVAFEAASTSDTFTMNGSTQGGLAGHRIVIRDVASGKFFIEAIGAATGTEATQFSAAV